MLKKRATFPLFLLITLLLIAGCTTQTSPNLPKNQSAQPATLILPTPLPAATDTTTATTATTNPIPAPTHVKTVQAQNSSGLLADPTFTNLRFVSNPSVGPQTVFAGGTEEVFAVWDYTGMSTDDTMKREWSYKGEVWLVREEVWDMAKYGSNGTVTDVSIFDFDGLGLYAGQYTLTLYINGQPQSFTETPAVPFTVNSLTSIDPITEPDGSRTASALGGRILLQDQAGSQDELAHLTEIADLAWFPDGQHLLAANRIYADHIPNNRHVAYELWLVSVNDGALTQLASIEENLHNGLISPNGRYIALTAGTGAGDACFAASTLNIMALDEQKQPIALYKMADIEGLPPDDGNDSLDFYPLTGSWQNDTTLDIPLNATCLMPDQPLPPHAPGLYRIDLNTLTAERIGDLES